MADQTVEQYRKQVGQAVERWSEKVAQAEKSILWVNKEIARIEALLECATESGEKKYKADIERLKESRTKLVQSIRSANDSLRIELMMIKMPEKTKSNEKDVLKLGGFLGELLKKKGLPLGGSGVVLKPDVDVDLKAGKLKKVGVEVRVDW
jgi:hypothetical protein